MKIKCIFFLIIVFIIISCHKKYNEVIVFNNNDFLESESDYGYIYYQGYLNINDLKNINLIKWILLNESGLEINKEIQMMIYYVGGIHNNSEFDITYKVRINKKQYYELMNKILSSKYSDSWRFYEEYDHLEFVRYNKFQLFCRIDKKYIIFKFYNREGIIP
jgi:hypothetical protein